LGEARKAVSRTLVVVLVVVIIVVAGVAAYYLVSAPSTSTTTSPSSSTSSTSSAKLATNQTLIADYTSSPGNLDPASDVEIAGFGIMGNILQPLAYYNNSDNFHIIPVLASSYTLSADGLTMTFTMRQGIKFSNGDPLNAYAVWFSYYRAAVMKQSGTFFYGAGLNLTGVTADQLNMLNSTTNTPPAALTPLLTNSANAITVPDANTVVFHFAKPFPDFFGWSVYGKVMDPRAIELHGGVVAGQANSWANLNPIGTGPFTLETWVQGSYCSLVRNPTYWGGPGHNVFPTPKLSRVVIYFVPNEATREGNILSGAAGVAAIDTPRISSVNGTNGVTLPNVGISNTYAWMPLDMAQYPLNITIVREAVVHAINYSEINQVVYHGLLYPSAGVVPYGLTGFNASMKPYSYDPTLAATLLTQAGFPGGKNFPTLSFVYATDFPETQSCAQVVQADLAKVGIQVSLKGMTFSQLIGTDYSTPANSTAHPSLQWVSITGSPIPSGTALPLFTTGNYGNIGGFSNPTVDSLINQASTTNNATLSAKLYEQASNIVYNSYSYYFLGNIRDFFPAQFFVFSSNVKGYYYQGAFSELDFSTVYLSG
jgi:peptide/nickel transport system substrate-binding protein